MPIIEELPEGSGEGLPEELDDRGLDLGWYHYLFFVVGDIKLLFVYVLLSIVETIRSLRAEGNTTDLRWDKSLPLLWDNSQICCSPYQEAFFLKHVKSYLEKGGDINQQDSEGHTLLHVAAKFQCVNVLKFLIPRADTTYTDNKGRTCLDVLVVHHRKWHPAHSFQKCLQLMVETRSNIINHQDRQGRAALDRAVGKRHSRPIRSLLDAGAQLNKTHKAGSTILIDLVFSDPVLLPVIPYWHEPFSESFELFCNHPEMIEMLNSQTSYNLLFHALKGRNAAAMRRLMSLGANVLQVDATGKTLLHLLMKESYPARRSVPKFTEIAELLYCQNPEIINIPDSEGLTPLHYAAQYRFMAGMRWCISHGADTGAQDQKGRTPLAVFIAHQHDWLSSRLPQGEYRTAARLLGGGVQQLSIRDSKGRLPLERAVEKFAADTVEGLIELGANPNMPGSKGTALHRLVDCYTGDFFEELLFLFPLVHCFVESKYTIRTSPDNFQGILELLLASQPTIINALDKKGRTPLDIASRRKRYNFMSESRGERIDEARDCLKQHGAKTGTSLKRAKIFQFFRRSHHRHPTSSHQSQIALSNTR